MKKFMSFILGSIVSVGLFTSCGGSNETTIKVEDGSKITIGGDEPLATGISKTVQVESGDYKLSLDDSGSGQIFTMKVRFKKISDEKGTVEAVPEALKFFSWNPELILLNDKGSGVENNVTLRMETSNLDKEELKKFVKFMLTSDKGATEEFVFTETIHNADLAKTVMSTAAGFSLKFHGNSDSESYSYSSQKEDEAYTYIPDDEDDDEDLDDDEDEDDVDFDDLDETLEKAQGDFDKAMEKAQESIDNLDDF